MAQLPTLCVSMHRPPGRQRSSSRSVASTIQPTACTMSVAAEDGDEALRRVEIHRPDLHEISEAAVGRDQLGDDRGADGVGEADAESREDVRHRAGEDDVARDLALVRADELRHLHELGVERAHARRAC